jgi:hypothetical protein
MSQNDSIILDTIIDQYKTNLGSDLNDGEVFSFFACEQILKDFDLSIEEIKSGNIGDGNDGGIDGFFIFIDGEIIEEEIEDISSIRKNPEISLYIIQSKKNKSFSETVFDKLIVTTSQIFSLEENISSTSFNEPLIEKINLFRKIFLDLSPKKPVLKIKFFYAARGDSNSVNNNVSIKANKLSVQTKQLLRPSEVSISLYGSSELLDLSRKEKSYTLKLNFIEQCLSKSENNYVVLSNIPDYYKFITNESGVLKKHIFESNVRDFQGLNEVNKDIMESLQSIGETDFWWLNNGVTIIASNAQIVGKSITLDDVEIVNGLQTTRCIDAFFKSHNTNQVDINSIIDNKSILIKIIITKDQITRDNIIKATNFQTSIPAASFRATERIQRNIEDFFKKHDWYYDRRKNYYKNLNKPAERIIGIPYLAQAMVAISNLEPHISRGRPTSIIKKDSEYEKIFSESFDIVIFLRSVQILKRVEKIIRNTSKDIDLALKRNFRFHIALSVVIDILNSKKYRPSEVANIDLEDISEYVVETNTKSVLFLAEKFIKDKQSTPDKTAKSKDFTDFLISSL